MKVENREFRDEDWEFRAATRCGRSFDSVLTTLEVLLLDELSMGCKLRLSTGEAWCPCAAMSSPMARCCCALVAAVQVVCLRLRPAPGSTPQTAGIKDYCSNTRVGHANARASPNNNRCAVREDADSSFTAAVVWLRCLSTVAGKGADTLVNDQGN